MLFAACPAQDGSTALHVAAARGHDDIVRRLMAAGAPVNATNEVRGYSVVQVLRLHCFLARRLQVNFILAPFPAFTPQHGKTPLDSAQTTGKAAVVQLLRAAEDTCSLHIAADEGSEPIVRRLLAMGAPVNAADEVREYRAPAS